MSFTKTCETFNVNGVRYALHFEIKMKLYSRLTGPSMLLCFH